MQEFQQYPRVMKHPQHRPAVVVKWDPKIKDPKEQKQGSPERFPDVIVKNFDQEQEYAAKGYAPTGKADPEAYRRAMTGNDPKPDAIVPYPKWLYRKVSKSKTDEVESKLVQDEAGEKALGEDWHRTPDEARAATAEKPKPAEAKAEAPEAKKAKQAGQAKSPEAEAARRKKIGESVKRRNAEKQKHAEKQQASA